MDAQTNWRGTPFTIQDMGCTLVRQKKAFLLIFGVFLALGLTAALFSQTIYEARSALAIGRIGGNLIEPSDTVFQRLYELNGLNDPLRSNRPLPFLEKVEAQANIIAVVTRGETSEEAIATATETLRQVAAYHKEIFQSEVARFTTRLEEVERNIKELEATLTTTGASESPALTLMTALNRDTAIQRLAQMRLERNELMDILSPRNTIESDYLRPAEEIRVISIPPRSLIILISFVVGLLVAVAVTLLIDRSRIKHRTVLGTAE